MPSCPNCKTTFKRQNDLDRHETGSQKCVRKALKRELFRIDMKCSFRCTVRRFKSSATLLQHYVRHCSLITENQKAVLTGSLSKYLNLFIFFNLKIFCLVSCC